jgi:hypothetical protein
MSQRQAQAKKGRRIEEPHWGDGKGQRHEPDRVSPSALQKGNLLGYGAPLAMY